MKKFTHTWWGRVSEKIYHSYRWGSEDLNVTQGSHVYVDFQDPDLGMIQVRGKLPQVSPHGLRYWEYKTELAEGTDFLFCVGYSEDRSRVEYLWLIPSSLVPSRSIRLSPFSQEYRFEKFERQETWGLDIAQSTLESCLGTFVYDRAPQTWSEDQLSQKSVSSKVTKGNWGKSFYQSRYPKSTFTKGEHYDFVDVDGTRVHVGFATLNKHGRWCFGVSSKWSAEGLDFDVFSCLCF
ncbi:MAG: hypothetical protein AAGM67_19885, partial [Bacteroidota bacterium]